ncbi:hypothetical protein AB0D67_19025 [Streptosporangium sp. NPDC048047]|uniref:hypothetical protein n=1 Tax=Streptosporangium sp. NPDC048047 TaxID=3155748 RepID=UPI0034323531
MTSPDDAQRGVPPEGAGAGGRVPADDGPSRAARPGAPDGVGGVEAALLALGEVLETSAPPPAEVAAAVRARLEAAGEGRPAGAPTGAGSRPEPPARRGARRAQARRGDGRGPGRVTRRRAAVAVAVAVALLLGVTPAGQAAVARVLRFAGIELRVGGPGPLPAGVAAPLPGERRVTLEEARRQAAFPVSVPAGLEEPADVRVADGGRVVSLLWPGVRLDEYDGVLQVVFRKELGPPWPEQVTVGASQGWWIPGPHGLVYLPRTAVGEAPARPRRADPTLIWQKGRTGLRLEGVADLRRALEIARSAR